MAAKAKQKKETTSKPTSTGLRIQVKEIQPKVATLIIKGTTPYVQHRFGEKARNELLARQSKGDKEKRLNKKDRKARGEKELDTEYKAAVHQSTKGWYGIPVMQIKASMVAALGMLGKYMKDGKRGLFIRADGYARAEKGEACGTELVKITKGKPVKHDSYVRLAGQGKPPDIRRRPMWEEGWQAVVRVEYDPDLIVDAKGQPEGTSIANLLMKAGWSIGIGEGRPDSPNSCGMNWGRFTLVGTRRTKK